MGITKKVGLFEAKTHLSALVEEVSKGAEIEITRRGVSVAKIVPVQHRDPVKIRAAAEALRRLAANQSLGGLTIKDLINEGRKY